MTTETDSWYPQVILIGNELTKNLTSLTNDFEIKSYDDSQAAAKILTLYCQVDYNCQIQKPHFYNTPSLKIKNYIFYSAVSSQLPKIINKIKIQWIWTHILNTFQWCVKT